MKTPRLAHQAGYALILMLLGLMGMGGVVLAGFTQQTKQDLELQRVEHNRTVLKEAKQALLMFAYSYPDTTGGGPGRLPCPDVDNDGTVDGAGTCAQVGRFPYADARLKTIRNGRLEDASGETLWYAVSDTFDNVAGGGTINSDTTGAITLVDQSGGILYDGNGAGIAAVIIAPGPIGKRDNDANGTYEYTQVRNTGPQQIDPRNYLDTFAGFDNSVFNNGESDSDDDGFILGPVYDSNASDIVVNDQLIIITADEVIAMAEKRVLAEYRDRLDEYRQTLWALPADYRYPWLNAYDDITDLDIYDTNVDPVLGGETTGRVPFLNYYVDNDTHTVITDLQIGFNITLNYTSMVDNTVPLDPGHAGVVDATYIDAFSALFTGFPAGAQTVTIDRASLSFSRKKFDGTIVDDDDFGTMIVKDDGTAAVTATPSNTFTAYFWDGCPTCLQPADGWEVCPVTSGWATDCARNAAGTAFTAFTAWPDHATMRIRKVRLRLTVDPDFEIELDYDPAPVIAAPSAPTGTANARFTTTFIAANVPDLSIANAAETNLRNFIDLEVVLCEQDDNVGANFNVASWAEEPDAAVPDAGTVPCSVDPGTVASHVFNADVTITADWYPQLPLWIADNGWDDSVMMTYAPDFAPGGAATCTPEDGDEADDCLVVTNLGGPNFNNVVSLLVLGGENDLTDGDDLNDDGDVVDVGIDVLADDDFSNDLFDIFEPENYSGIGPYPTFPYVDPDPGSDTGWGLVFDKREDVVMDRNAADTVFVLEQL
jgi:hypothetical protein